MTGKWIFNAAGRLAVLLIFAGVTNGHADQVTLTPDGHLTGSVRAIDPAGVVELVSPLTSEPMLLAAGAVSKVEFSPPDREEDPPSALVELVNGDVLPATILGFDGTKLDVETADAGALAIPREALKSLQLGIRRRNVVYAGPLSLDEWTRDRAGAQSWTFANNSLIANGPAVASRKFVLPQQFVLKFTLQWESNPNVKVYFADPLMGTVEVADRYYMQFNGAGLEVKRESSKGEHFRTVILLPRVPENYPTKTLAVEIRVDRKTSRIHLLLNGQPEATVIDPVPVAPSGDGVLLVNSASAGTNLRFSEIEVAEFDNARARHRAEDRGDPKTDSLISRDEDRWGGSLTGIRHTVDGAVYLFKSDFQEQPLELRETDVSTIFFAAADPPAAAAARDHPFALRLTGDGVLRVSSCAFSDDRVTAEHQLLGTLEVNRDGVTALERLDQQPAEDSPDE